jgi:hypothetical protein
MTRKSVSKSSMLFGIDLAIIVVSMMPIKKHMAALIDVSKLKS